MLKEELGIPYPKIDTLFERDSDFNVTDVLRNPVIATINEWDVDEKVDGTNVRVMFVKDAAGAPIVRFGGRTDNAQMPTDLLKYLQDTFTLEKLLGVFGADGSVPDVVMYGEGYGPGIQACGGRYRKDKSFRLFDVLINGKSWLDVKTREGIASSLAIKTVPYLGRMGFEEIVALVKEGFSSITASEDGGDGELEAEGIVARPIEPLYDRRHNRLIIKLKTIDFRHERKGSGTPA